MITCNKYDRLVKNTVVFMIGNFGSKLISFLIVPFYTYVLTTAEYGTIDLFTTSINILLPFLIISLNEAVLRFLVGGEMDKNVVATNCCAVFFVSMFLVWVFFPLYYKYEVFQGCALQFAILVTIMSFNQLFIQYLRGIGKNVAYAMNGVIVTLVMVLSNLYFLLYLKMGVQGYFYSMILAQMVSMVHIIVTAQLWKDIHMRHLSMSRLGNMVQYSFPLIPNSLMWWIMSASDKYLINYYVDTSANGIYTVAQKFPTLINLLYSIFMQAWQISAIEEKQANERTELFNTVYNVVSTALVIMATAIIAISKPLYVWVMNVDYRIAWQCVPFLIIANMFSCLTGFFGTTYVVNKKSKKAFATTCVGALLNLLMNILLIPQYGIIGASIGTMIGYGVSCLVRAWDTKKSIHMNLESKKMLVTILVMLFQSVCIFIKNRIFFCLLQILSISIIVRINWRPIQVIWRFLIQRVSGLIGAKRND